MLEYFSALKPAFTRGAKVQKFTISFIKTEIDGLEGSLVNATSKKLSKEVKTIVVKILFLENVKRLFPNG